MWKLGWGLHLSQSCFNEVRSQPLGAASEHPTLANYPFKVRNVFFSFFQQMELHFLITQIYVAIEILLFYLCCIRTIRVMKGRLRESAKLQQTLQSRSPEVLISTYLHRSPDHLRANRYQLHPLHNIHLNPSSARLGDYYSVCRPQRPNSCQYIPMCAHHPCDNIRGFNKGSTIVVLSHLVENIQTGSFRNLLSCTLPISYITLLQRAFIRRLNISHVLILLSSLNQITYRE